MGSKTILNKPSTNVPPPNMNFIFKILKVEFTNKKSYPTTISFEIEIKFLENEGT